MNKMDEIIARIVTKLKAFNDATSHSVQTRPTYLSNTADAVISGYKTLSKSNDSSLTTITTTVKQTDGEKLLYAFLMPSNMGVTTIDAGTWTFDLCCGISSNMATTKYRYVVFRRDTGGTETTLFSVYSNPISNVTANGLRMLKTRSTQPPFTVTATDRIGVKVYVLTNSQSTLTLSVGVGGTATTSYISTTLPLDIVDVVDWGTTYTATIAPNKFNKWGTLTSANTLAITLGVENSAVMNNFVFEFKTGASVPTFSPISGVTWSGSNPTLAINKTYHFSIVNGIGVWCYA